MLYHMYFRKKELNSERLKKNSVLKIHGSTLNSVGIDEYEKIFQWPIHPHHFPINGHRSLTLLSNQTPQRRKRKISTKSTQSTYVYYLKGKIKILEIFTNNYLYDFFCNSRADKLKAFVTQKIQQPHPTLSFCNQKMVPLVCHSDVL